VKKIPAIFLLFIALTSCSANASLDPDETNFVKTKLPDLTPKAIIHTNFENKDEIKIDESIEITVEKGSLKAVEIVDSHNELLNGKLTSNKWVSTDRLKNAEEYEVKATAIDSQYIPTNLSTEFQVEKLPLDKLVYPSILPVDDSKVGIAMPVVIMFDIPVTEKEEIQKHITVENIAGQPGAFYWKNSQELHWRPKDYWEKGNKVTVDVAIEGVPAGDGKYGQVSKKSEFKIDNVARLVKVDIDKKQMVAIEDGEEVKTISISTGKNGFATRHGIKVIASKHRYVNMNSASIGINPNGAEGYDLDNVEYAMRLTNSGEFIHAAPWNTGLFGVVNGSHGCTGMATANAAWLYNWSSVGTPVEYKGGSGEKVTLENGFGDWNLSFKDYAKGNIE
jgi:lipoprotein-anchoring transpeptidase ErfK/SrfK